MLLFLCIEGVDFLNYGKIRVDANTKTCLGHFSHLSTHRMDTKRSRNQWSLTSNLTSNQDMNGKQRNSQFLKHFISLTNFNVVIVHYLSRLGDNADVNQRFKQLRLAFDESPLTPLSKNNQKARGLQANWEIWLFDWYVTKVSWGFKFSFIFIVGSDEWTVYIN